MVASQNVRCAFRKDDRIVERYRIFPVYLSSLVCGQICLGGCINFQVGARKGINRRVNSFHSTPIVKTASSRPFPHFRDSFPNFTKNKSLLPASRRENGLSPVSILFSAGCLDSQIETALSRVRYRARERKSSRRYFKIPARRDVFTCSRF